jgi:hypothetical protein
MRAIIDKLVDDGIDLPDEIKRRDKREPLRDEKERVEDRITALFKRRFRRQQRKFLDLVQGKTGRKADITFDEIFNDDEDDDWYADFIAILTAAARSGIELLDKSVGLSMDYTLTNIEAAKWARDYAYSLITRDEIDPLTGKRMRGIDAVSREALSKSLTSFIETPGMTIGDLTNQIAPVFGEDRALSIAVTETTRAYAEGQKLAGETLKEEFPDVRVVKTWFTNNDDLVCEICAPLNGEEVDIDQPFSSGDDAPPAHPLCRCWLDTRTRING